MEVWQEFRQLTNAFLHLSTFPSSIEEEVMSYIETFVVRLYDGSIESTSVNAARLELFYYKARDFDHLPPTKDALFQHTLRAAYQAGHVWGQALITCPVLPEPSQWGWMKKETSWVPLWTTIPPISKGLKDLVTCQCKKECKPPCKCFMADVKCSTLCFCQGNCFRK